MGSFRQLRLLAARPQTPSRPIRLRLTLRCISGPALVARRCLDSSPGLESLSWAWYAAVPHHNAVAHSDLVQWVLSMQIVCKNGPLVEDWCTTKHCKPWRSDSCHGF